MPDVIKQLKINSFWILVSSESSVIRIRTEAPEVKLLDWSLRILTVHLLLVLGLEGVASESQRLLNPEAFWIQNVPPTLISDPLSLALYLIFGTSRTPCSCTSALQIAPSEGAGALRHMFAHNNRPKRAFLSSFPKLKGLAEGGEWRRGRAAAGDDGDEGEEAWKGAESRNGRGLQRAHGGAVFQSALSGTSFCFLTLKRQLIETLLRCKFYMIVVRRASATSREIRLFPFLFQFFSHFFRFPPRHHTALAIHIMSL